MANWKRQREDIDIEDEDKESRFIALNTVLVQVLLVVPCPSLFFYSKTCIQYPWCSVPPWCLQHTVRSTGRCVPDPLVGMVFKGTAMVLTFFAAVLCTCAEPYLKVPQSHLL